MKKLLVALALCMGMGTSAFAQSNVQDVAQDKTSVAAQTGQDEYKTVKVADLNKEVQDAVKAFEATHTVSKVEFNADKKLTKVTLECKETKAGKVVVLDESGKEVK